jgi:hypothetical protein
MYEIDPRALDLVTQVGAGAGHLAIIENAVKDADDPRVGEATIRLAYALAASSGVTSYTSVHVVSEAASQVRDRVLARRDLLKSVSSARRAKVDLLDEINRRRAARDLSVEQPALGALDIRARDAAIAAAPHLLEKIRRVVVAEAPAPTPKSLLDQATAKTLAKLAPRLPPLSAVRVPVTGRIATLRADSGLARSALAVIRTSSNEESLVAAYAYSDHASEGRSASLRRLMVSAGVSLRAHAQDEVWFPGLPAPTARAVADRFDLKTITFDRDVPRDWRPFYVQMIASALEDFSLAVPGYDPAGLSFHVHMGALQDSALAMHDPRTHTIRLSALTPTGTLAHELAHDLDWSAARRLFAKAGGYATDRSLRETGVRLASSVRGLTQARVVGRGRISPQGSSRPAEVFARSTDWYVADVLASMGRSNGNLTAIEDHLLAGFAATASDAPALEAARALASTLDELTAGTDSVRAAFVRRWSTPEDLDPASLVARTMDAAVYMRRYGRTPFGITRDIQIQLGLGLMCRVEAMAAGSAQDRLLKLAIDARAEGMATRRARSNPSSPRRPQDTRLAVASVAEGLARQGLFEFAPAPFRPRCN